jgi:hypothetical protein
VHYTAASFPSPDDQPVSWMARAGTPFIARCEQNVMTQDVDARRHVGPTSGPRDPVLHDLASAVTEALLARFGTYQRSR